MALPDEPTEPLVPNQSLPVTHFLERLGVRSDEEGRLVVKLGPEHLRSLGIAHGGFIATLIDSVMGRDAGRLAPSDHYVVTAQLNVHFIRPGWEGETVLATAQLRHRGRKTAVGQAEVRTEAGALIATGSGTFLYVAHTAATRVKPDQLDPGMAEGIITAS